MPGLLLVGKWKEENGRIVADAVCLEHPAEAPRSRNHAEQRSEVEQALAMASRSEWLWYLLGVLLLALPGLITVDNRLFYFGLFGAGWLCVVLALRANGIARPNSAIALLVVTNVAFWFSYGLCKLRPVV